MDSTTLFGGEELSVSFKDGTADTVRVLQLDVDSWPKYSLIANKEKRAVELFCNKPEGWAETLAPESFDRVIEKGEEINLPFYERWCRRMDRRNEIFNPGIGEKRRQMTLEAMQRASDRATEQALSALPSPDSTT